MNADLLLEIQKALQAGQAKTVRNLIQQALDEGLSASRILDDGLLAGMKVVSETFRHDDSFVQDVMIAARAMRAGSDLLEKLLEAEGHHAPGSVVIGTVQGDLHDIGKNLVGMMVRGKGLEVIDLGTDVPAERFVQAVRQHDARIVCCSALLTTTMAEIKAVVDAFKFAKIRDQVQIMVGGGPVSELFCRQVGADYYEPDAVRAADKIAKIAEVAYSNLK